MASSQVDLKGFINIMKKIDDIYGERLESLRRAFVAIGTLMVNDFRGVQWGAPQIDSPGSNKADNADKKARALQWAKEHSGTVATQRGRTWFNRSFRAARGVHPYVGGDENYISVGLAHTMSYGAYLELGHNRRYAILEPIIRQYAPKIMQEVKRIMG